MSIAMQLDRAIQIAVEAHFGQKDKGGAPYILHPLRVMLRMATDAERVAAVLHDVVEDTPWTLDGLRAVGFADDVVEAVDHLTRREEETYKEYIVRLRRNAIARRVKMADLEDNLDVRRMPAHTTSEHGFFTRYRTAYAMLQEVEG